MKLAPDAAMPLAIQSRSWPCRMNSCQVQPMVSSLLVLQQVRWVSSHCSMMNLQQPWKWNWQHGISRVTLADLKHCVMLASKPVECAVFQPVPTGLWGFSIIICSSYEPIYLSYEYSDFTCVYDILYSICFSYYLACLLDLYKLQHPVNVLRVHLFLSLLIVSFLYWRITMHSHL